MYNSQKLTQNIKSQAKEKNINLRDMLIACNLGINAINQISDKKGISVFSIAKIADHLNCSVDYLLGRTDNPQIQGKYRIESVGDILRFFLALDNLNINEFKTTFTINNTDLSDYINKYIKIKEKINSIPDNISDEQKEVLENHYREEINILIKEADKIAL